MKLMHTGFFVSVRSDASLTRNCERYETGSNLTVRATQDGRSQR
jgi:hypothetical protein